MASNVIRLGSFINQLKNQMQCLFDVCVHSILHEAVSGQVNCKLIPTLQH